MFRYAQSIYYQHAPKVFSARFVYSLLLPTTLCKFLLTIFNSSLNWNDPKTYLYFMKNFLHLLKIITYSSILLTYSSIINLKLTKTQSDKLLSLERRAYRITGKKVKSIECIIKKRAINMV